MSEKNVSSSNPNNLECTITPCEGGFILNGSKYFISSASDERTIFGIVIGKSTQTMSNPNES